LDARTAAIVARVAAPALTPELALVYLDQLSTDITAGVVLGSDGSLAAASRSGAEGERMGELVRELFEKADAADDQSVSQVEVSTGDGALYATRNPDWTIAVVTGRFALPSLMFYDLHTVLGALEQEKAA
jgi:hypothetical protein